VLQIYKISRFVKIGIFLFYNLFLNTGVRFSRKLDIASIRSSLLIKAVFQSAIWFKAGNCEFFFQVENVQSMVECSSE
jgi:hypothetical protein